MKTTRLSHLTLLLLSCVFVRDSLAGDYTRLLLPGGARVRFGEAVLTGEIAFSPNGAWLAAPSSIGTWLYNARTGRLKARLRTGFVRAVAFAPDSRILAAASGREVQLWKVGSGRLETTLEGHEGFVRSVAFAPDGRTLASGGGDRTIRLWEAGTGRLEATLDGHAGEVEALAFSPDGRTLASAGGDHAILLWDTQTGKHKAVLEGHTGWIESVAFAPDGETLASGGWDGTIRLWDAGTAQPKTVLEGHSGYGLAEWVWSVAFAPDGKTLASGHDHAMRLWDVETGHFRSALTPDGHTSWVSSVAFSPDGKTLASGSRSRNGNESRHFSVLLWDLSSRTEVEAVVAGGNAGLTVEFSRAVAGRRRDYAWSAVTDTAGRLELTLFPGVTGFYEARARAPDGTVAGRWNSIPLNAGERQFLELTLGGGMRVVDAEQLAAAKVAAPPGPAESELHPNAPNPFNSSTRIAYRLAASGPVRLEIYNLLGQPVRTLVDQTQAAGAYQVTWDSRDRRGAAVAAGIYFTRLACPGGVQTRRLVLLK